MKRDWSAIQTDRDTPCRVCGSVGKTERAHVAGRRHDRLARSDNGVALSHRVVDPDSIVPLCGPATDSSSCHYLYDAHRLDLLPHLTPAEEVRAVADLGGIEAARRRLAPSDYQPAIDRARRQALLEADCAV